MTTDEAIKKLFSAREALYNSRPADRDWIACEIIGAAMELLEAQESHERMIEAYRDIVKRYR